MTKWQPIDTAPKDGRRILIFQSDGEIVVAAWAINFRRDRQTWVIPEIDGPDTGVWDPTHWMPLPDPPSYRSPK